jgi:hypothetical protein
MSIIKLLLTYIICTTTISLVNGEVPSYDQFATIIKQSPNKYDTDKNYLIFNIAKINAPLNNRDDWNLFLKDNCDLTKDCLYAVLYNHNGNVDNPYIMDESYNKSVDDFSNKAYKALALNSSRSNSKFDYYVAWDISIDSNSNLLSYKMKYFNMREDALIFNETLATGIKFLYDSTIAQANRFDALNTLLIGSINLKNAFYSFAAGGNTLPAYVSLG